MCTYDGNRNSVAIVRKCGCNGHPCVWVVFRTVPMSTKAVPKAQHVEWNNIIRGEYIKEWYDRGYQPPAGG